MLILLIYYRVSTIFHYVTHNVNVVIKARALYKFEDYHLKLKLKIIKKKFIVYLK